MTYSCCIAICDAHFSSHSHIAVAPAYHSNPRTTILLTQPHSHILSHHFPHHSPPHTATHLQDIITPLSAPLPSSHSHTAAKPQPITPFSSSHHSSPYGKPKVLQLQVTGSVKDSPPGFHTGRGESKKNAFITTARIFVVQLLHISPDDRYTIKSLLFLIVYNQKRSKSKIKIYR